MKIHIHILSETIAFIMAILLTGYALSALYDGTWEPLCAWLVFLVSETVSLITGE